MTTPLRIQRRRTRGAHLPPGTVCCTRPGAWGNCYRPGETCCFGSSFLPGPDDWSREVALPRFRERCPDTATAVQWFVELLDRCPEARERARRELRGRNLACWCALCPEHRDGRAFGVRCDACAVCHVDWLGVVANG